MDNMDADTMGHATVALQGDADRANGDRIEADGASTVDTEAGPEEAVPSVPTPSRSATENEDEEEEDEDEDDRVIEQAWKRRKGILLHFHDLPSWSEEEARRNQQQKAKETRASARRAPASTRYNKVPQLQELCAMVAGQSAQSMAGAILDLPEYVLDLVRAYMDRDVQVELFKSFKDFYQPISPGKKRQLRTVNNYNEAGQLDGESRWYFPDGQIEDQEHYRSDLLHGVAKAWYPNGQIEAEREWKEGVLNGQAKEWYPDGTMKTHEMWRDGVREKVIITNGRKIRPSFLALDGHRTAKGGFSPLVPSTSGLDWLSLDHPVGKPRWRG